MELCWGEADVTLGVHKYAKAQLARLRGESAIWDMVGNTFELNILSEYHNKKAEAVIVALSATTSEDFGSEGFFFPPEVKSIPSHSFKGFLSW